MTDKKKNEFVAFDVSKPNLKSAIKAHKRFAVINKQITGDPLECVHFEKKGAELILKTTDGQRGLITTLSLFTDNGLDGSFCINMGLLSKMFFTAKGQLETITITQKEEQVEFFDNDTDTIQIFKTSDCKYPPLEDVMPPQTKRTKIGVSKNLIKDLASLKTNRGSVLEMYIGKPLDAIVVKTTGEDIRQTALVMPLLLDKQDLNS